MKTSKENQGGKKKKLPNREQRERGSPPAQKKIRL
jgi:hypothetical protein